MFLIFAIPARGQKRERRITCGSPPPRGDGGREGKMQRQTIVIDRFPTRKLYLFTKKYEMAQYDFFAGKTHIFTSACLGKEGGKEGNPNERALRTC